MPVQILCRKLLTHVLQISCGCSFAVLCLTVLGGCASAKGPEYLTVTSNEYSNVFIAAGEVTTEQGMPPLVNDRVGGVIEGRPRLAGSLIEPWRVESSSARQLVESSMNTQRRRVRFEFLPIEFKPNEPTGEGVLQGPIVPGSTMDEVRSVDLINHQGEIEVRVWVYVERKFQPYLQRNTWSRVGTDFAEGPADDVPDDGSTRSQSLWTPVGRDKAMERRLLSQLSSRLTAQAE